MALPHAVGAFCDSILERRGEVYNNAILADTASIDFRCTLVAGQESDRSAQSHLGYSIHLYKIP